MNTIVETVTRIVVDVDWTDEGDVVLRTRKRKTPLTPDQARELAAALIGVADEVDRAVAGAVRPVTAQPFDVDMLGPWRGQVETIAVEVGATVVHPEHISPDCRAGKHPHGWQDTAWDDEADVEVPCECACHDANPAGRVEPTDGAA